MSLKFETKKKIFFIFSIILSLLVNLLIINNHYSHFLVLMWVLSITFFIDSTLEQIEVNLPKIRLTKELLITLFVILLPTIIRVLSLEEKRIHQDGFITAYFSANYDFRTTNFFSAIPQDKSDWVSQFPTPFFLFQKIFFLLFGANQWTVKLSVMPYVFITSLMIFLIVKEIFDRRLAIISLTLYSFFAAGLYLDTLGLHFTSSDAAFMIFFYLSILNFRRNKPVYAALAGISCGLCYLFHLSSYVAFPILILFFLFELIQKRKVVIIEKYLLAIFSFFLTITPFLSYNYKYYKFDNYMFERFKQISFTNEVREKNTSSFLVLKKNLEASVKSLYLDEVGGSGGYDFGHQALFEKISLAFFLAGLILSLKLIFKRIELLFILISIAAFFLGGVVLTSMPPHYHRFSISFPLISIVSSIPFYILILSKKINLKIKLSIVFVLLSIYSINNLSYFLRAVKIDKDNRHWDLEHIKVIDYIKENFPERKVYIAAYPSFALEKVYYFFDQERKVRADFHDNFLKNFNKDEKYIYIIVFPDQFNEKFRNADQNGRIIDNVSIVYSLFVN